MRKAGAPRERHGGQFIIIQEISQMAFITNQKGVGAKKLGERLGELMGHADRLDMLVGFFFFSGVKVLVVRF